MIKEKKTFNSWGIRTDLLNQSWNEYSKILKKKIEK